MYCVSVSYKSADVNLRKWVAFSENIRREISLELVEKTRVNQCVLLCTCNRTEIYFCGEKCCESDVVEVLSHYAEIDKDLLCGHLLFYCGDNAILHLFKVACGIDSMVIGEDEILGQTKNAYFFAKENNTTAYELNMIFQAAFACAKKIKTETALSKTSVSVATLAANEVAKLGDKVHVLVIGASGKIGTTVLKNLVSHKNITVKATLRNHSRDENFAELSGVKTVDYNERYEYIRQADCVISATASPHYTVTKYGLENCLKDKSACKKRLFIDLAVPPDIDSSVTKLDGVCLVNIDYFECLAKENNALKMNSVDTAKQMIKEEIDSLKKDLLFHDFMPHMEAIKASLTDKPIEKIIYKMKSDTTADEFSSFLKVMKAFEDI